MQWRVGWGGGFATKATWLIVLSTMLGLAPLTLLVARSELPEAVLNAVALAGAVLALLVDAIVWGRIVALTTRPDVLASELEALRQAALLGDRRLIDATVNSSANDRRLMALQFSLTSPASRSRMVADSLPARADDRCQCNPSLGLVPLDARATIN